MKELTLEEFEEIMERLSTCGVYSVELQKIYIDNKRKIV